MKKLESDKNESFNIIREKESITRKVKKAKNVHGKPLGRDEKPRVSKREYPLLFQALYNVKNGSFSLYNYGVLPKREVFSLPHFLTNFLLFSLRFSPGSSLNGPTTCSFYSPRNVVRYKRQVSNHNSSIRILRQLLYYVMAGGERVSMLKSG